MNYRIKTNINGVTIRTYNGYGNFYMTSVHENERRIESAVTLYEADAIEKHFLICNKYFQDSNK